MSTKQKRPVGRPPHLNYDADEVYDEIFIMAFNGATDKDIPVLLSEKFNTAISYDLFQRWKSGKYPKWTKEQNALRSKRLVGVLERARAKIVFALKNSYMKMALGQVGTKNVATTKRHLVVNGVQTDDELVQTTENAIQYPPNLQAISVLLFHYDPEWRKVQKGIEESEDGIPRNIDHGISIDAWIRREAEVGEKSE